MMMMESYNLVTPFRHVMQQNEELIVNEREQSHPFVFPSTAFSAIPTLPWVDDCSVDRFNAMLHNACTSIQRVTNIMAETRNQRRRWAASTGFIYDRC